MGQMVRNITKRGLSADTQRSIRSFQVAYGGYWKP